MTTANCIEESKKNQENHENPSEKTEKKTKKKAPFSFMKSAFAGDIAEEIIFPYPQQSKEEKEETQLFLKELDKFCRENIDGAQIDLDAKIPPEVIQGLADLGVFGLTVPEEYDGLDVSYTFFCQAIGIIPRYCASLAATVVAHLSIGTKALYMFGTEDQKKRYYPKLVTGEWIAAFSLTEPQAGSDASGIKTSAKLSEDGKHYVLSGEKIYVTNGGFASFFTVFAKINSGDEEEKGFTAFIVTKDMHGVSIGKEEKKLGLKGSSTTPLLLDNVKVPVDNILGQKGKGFKIAMEVLNTGRLGLGGICAGGVKKAIEGSVQYATQRRQFGMSLSEFGLIQKKIARMGVLTFAMDSAVYLTAGLADRKDIDFSVESAICKVFTTECAWEIINETVQIFGGSGFIADYPYERALRDARITMIFEGTNEILRLFIALAGMRNVGEYFKKLGQAINQPLQSLGFLYEYFSGQVISSFVKEKINNASAQLSSEAAIVQKYIPLLNQAVEKSIRTHKKEVIHQQFILERVANMAISIYTLAACISRVDSSLRQGKTEADLDQEFTMLKTYAFIAEASLQENYQSLTNNCDKEIQKVSAFLCAAEGYPLPDVI